MLLAEDWFVAAPLDRSVRIGRAAVSKPLSGLVENAKLKHVSSVWPRPCGECRLNSRDEVRPDRRLCIDRWRLRSWRWVLCLDIPMKAASMEDVDDHGSAKSRRIDRFL